MAATGTVQADPLATAGVGLASCEKLARDLKPEQGFSHMPNALVYYWVQGYMSAANVATLEADGEYVDPSKYDEKVILPAVQAFCAKNPDRKGQGRQAQGQMDQGHHQMGGGLSFMA